MKIVRQVVFTLFALMFLNAGLNKLFNYLPAPELTPEQAEAFAAFVKLKWLFPLLGVMETLSAVLIIVPKTRPLGAITVFPIMVGILLHHSIADPNNMPGLAIAVVLFIINIWMIADNRKKYLPMIA